MCRHYGHHVTDGTEHDDSRYGMRRRVRGVLAQSPRRRSVESRNRSVGEDVDGR